MKKITNLTRTPIDLGQGVALPALASIDVEVTPRIAMLEKVKAITIQDVAPEPAKRGRPAKVVEAESSEDE
jgi:hypothetical protein